ncbi:glycoside hydrolase, partial [Mycobacterium intracellulare subsp. chimaera]
MFAKGAGRWLAVAASLVVSAAMIHAQGTKPRCCAETPAAAPSPTTSAAASAAPPSPPHTASP